MLGHGDQIRQAGHGAVFFHYLANHPGGVEAGQPAQVNDGLSMAGARQDAALVVAQREQVAGLDEVLRARAGSMSAWMVAARSAAEMPVDVLMA